ncbi:MAG TPA: hypothetical protein VKR30_02570 [Candidatus Limnocylindrales bacterium]|nr:hypothetical protein [Candidatus Limnocylindrales bacterium]
MNLPGTSEARVREWLEAGPDEAPTELVEAVLAELPAARQRRRWEVGPSALPPAAFRLAAAAVVLVFVAALIVVGGVLLAGTQPKPLTWTPISDVGALSTGSIADAISWKDGVLVVGSASTTGRTVGLAWTSADGLTWRVVGSGATTLDLGMSRVATNGAVLVALAYACAPGPGYCGASTLLASADGVSWRIATISGCCSPGDLSFLDVTSGGPGFVAVGGRGANTLTAAAVATSVDGSAWDAGPSNAQAFGGSSMSGVAASPSRLVAVGLSPAGPSAWLSADGRAWAVEPLPTAAGSALVNDVAAGEGRFVAVGRLDTSAAVWTSVDGTSWSMEAGTPSLDSARMTRVLWTGREYLALGSSSAGNGLAWLSVDGVGWTRLDTGSIFAGTPIVAGARLGSIVELFGTSSAGRQIVAIGHP